MKALLRLFLLVLVAFSATLPVPAQRLPTGRYHTNRERTYDILHYKAELRLDLRERRVEGVATIELQPLRRLRTIALDAIQLEVETVSLAQEKTELAFDSEPKALTISLPAERGPEDTLTLEIRYACTPRAGMYFQPDPRSPDRLFVTTYGEGSLHANWLPIYGDINDKFSTEMVVTVPQTYTVISNGKLIDRYELPDGGMTFHWLQERPHSNYLISLYVGHFEKGDLEPAFSSIPLAYWVPRGRLEEGAHAFRNTTRMVEFFSRRFGYTYPWVKYDQIAVPDYAVGAMENTGVTGHNASVLRQPDGAPLDFGGPTFDEVVTDWSAEATISHELAHHWFGDNLTCRNLSHIWLNESFASYLMMLWDEESIGRNQLLFDVHLARIHYFAYVDEEHLIRPLEYPYFDSPDVIYNTEHTYLKGAAVLHMLRAVLGDEAFFQALSHYLHEHEFANVESRDLKIAIEEATGQNLDWFFAQWVTGGGHPRFEVSSRYLADRGLIDIEVKQVQAIVEGQGLFRLPVDLTIATPSGTWEERVWVEKARERLLIPSREKPLMVSFDGEGDLVAEIDFEKGIDELVYQATHDNLVGRLRALQRLAADFPTRKETLETFEGTLTGGSFWALQAEATLLLGRVRTPGAEKVLARALAASDYRVRKAAVLALPEFGTSSAERTLARVMRTEPHSDVAGTAILALARANPEVDPELITEQLQRESWYDEIRIAALEALEELGRRELVPALKSFAGPAYNRHVREAALNAWEASSPTDRELHATLLGMLDAPPYPLQKLAIEMVGRLSVSEAIQPLEELVELDVDTNLTVLAKAALGEIRRIEEKSRTLERAAR